MVGQLSPFSTKTAIIPLDLHNGSSIVLDTTISSCEDAFMLDAWKMVRKRKYPPVSSSRSLIQPQSRIQTPSLVASPNTCDISLSSHPNFPSPTTTSPKINSSPEPHMNNSTSSSHSHECSRSPSSTKECDAKDAKLSLGNSFSVGSR